MIKAVPVYIRLLHGRDNPDQAMNGWGFAGPILGPFACVHFTYMTDIRCISENHDEINLVFQQDMLAYDGKFYGDFEISTEEGGVRIPTQTSRRFRSIPAGNSDGSQPLIPTHSSHP